jgi:hypothetical protein
MGADAFAVATLEEGIALRKALQQTPPGATYKSGQPLAKKTSASVNRVSSLFQNQSETQSTLSPMNSSAETGPRRQRFQRAFQIRILVLGPAIYVPRCFDDYCFYNIEVMISGPEVAKALLEWVHNTEERKRTQVERAATETKELAMQLQRHNRPAPPQWTAEPTLEKKDSSLSDASSEQSGSNGDLTQTQKYRQPSATLGNVTGMDLAKEVRQILKNQQSNGSEMSNSSTNAPVSAGANPVTTQVFAGIEEAAKVSRSRHKAIIKEAFVETGDEEDDTKSTDVPSIHQKPPAVPVVSRKRLRWHALVDSGMGRLGFRTDPVPKSEQGNRRDTVDILSELVDIENNLESPVEFIGMCTHMADANSSSDYTHSQIARFKVNYKLTCSFHVMRAHR